MRPNSSRLNRRSERIVVVGAGIIGSAIAYHLAKYGAQVTVVEKNRPASGTTEKSFGWINATFSKKPWHYFLLNHLGIAAWQALQQELNKSLQVQWGGSIEWYSDVTEASALQENIRRHQSLGYATQLVDEAKLSHLEPNVAFGHVAAAAFCEHEGHVDPAHAVHVLLGQAQKMGAQVITECELTDLVLNQGRLQAVKTSVGEIEADVLVIACGVDSPRVAALADVLVPLKDSPGVLVYTKPKPVPGKRLLHRIVLSPGGHMKQQQDGRIVIGASFGGSPTTDTSIDSAKRILEEAARYLPALNKAQIDQVTLGWRPMPKDDYPIIGFANGEPSVYLAVTHSGITLGPLIGQLATVEILNRVDVTLLQSYRLSRFDPK